MERIEFEVTMDSREIAEKTGKEHSNVIRDIKSMFESLEIDGLSFESIYLDVYGREKKCYKLTEHYVLLLITGYSTPLRDEMLRYLKVLKMAAMGIPDFNDPVHAARAWADEVEQKQGLKAKIVEMTPAHDFGKTLLDAKEKFYSISEAAKIMEPVTGLGPIQLMKWLRTWHFLKNKIGMAGRELRDHNAPYEQYVKNRCFGLTIENVPIKGNISVPIISDKGIAYVLKRFKQIRQEGD